MNAIFSGDPQAIEKLETKLAILKEYQDFMKMVNKGYKKEGVKFIDTLADLSDAMRNDIVYNITKDFRKVPFPDYYLSNNNGVMANTRKRIAYLKKIKEVQA